jgi:hypothetical protein
MQHEQMIQMGKGVAASAGGLSSVAVINSSSWLGDHYSEIGAICMIIGAVCSVAGLIYTLYRGRGR